MGDANVCGCEFSNVDQHDDGCRLFVPLLRKLYYARERAIERQDFEAAAAIRDAMKFIRDRQNVPDDRNS